ncbi:protealysin inhibitor emfourin [Vitiosangium sp. GDMCC 1.1324]|uniref:protealysin inhibitor emfourin n=1 Tax=Vitiosangium sp. (strain GDMCC 1.1324) TaxID=2138576 RepID=UPI000D362CF4|nr:protealysin inhibitor emfourin [Vitiosangium sp. GDMCC 1.1324]PTL78155.1 hypothetical protein DAT35_41220 [Vitiosangium sp. GDMCC 1.1324]
MRITLKKHGGQTAGMRMPEQRVDVAALDTRTAEKLTGLVQSAVRAGPGERSPRAAPDAMNYSITIDENGRSTTLWGSDTNMTEPFAELLDYLENLGFVPG